MSEQGLIHKYNVYKAENGEQVTDCFVLRPEKDDAARIALLAYAKATPNVALAQDIYSWMLHSTENKLDDEFRLHFFYCDSEDSYLLGERKGTFYYAHWSPRLGFVWDTSRNLPWGEHIVSHGNAWKEHTYPSEPRIISRDEWFKGFIAQQAALLNQPKTSSELQKAKQKFLQVLGETFGLDKLCNWIVTVINKRKISKQ